MDNKVFTARKAVLAVFLGIGLLVLAQGVSKLAYKMPVSKGVAIVVAGLLYVTIAYILTYLCCSKVLHISMEECHIGRLKFNIRWIICAFLLPFLVSAVFIFCVPGELVRNNIDNKHMMNIVLSAIFSAGLGAGVVEEMVFRGLIMKALEKRWGKIVAVTVPSVVFGLLHAIGRNMNVIDILLLFVAGTSVGIMLSLIVYESGSIWCSAIVHGIWNVIMIGEILEINAEYNPSAIFSYRLLPKSLVLTGGEFGVESSIISVLGYITVIFIALFLLKRKANNSKDL